MEVIAFLKVSVLQNINVNHTKRNYVTRIFSEKFHFLLSQGFLMEDKLLKLLAPLEKEEQVVVKLGSLISVSSCPVIFLLCPHS